jgi:hypothetical protein
MDLTMLRQMSRRGRVDAMLKDALEPSTDGAAIPMEVTAIQNLAQILQPKDASIDCAPIPLAPTEIATALKNAPNLDEFDYAALLHYLRGSGRQYRDFNDFPHPKNALVLPPRAETPLQLQRGECTFSCRHSHEGNSAITFYNPSTQARATGFIEKIWRLPLEGSMQSFVVVRPHRRLSAIEEGMAPFQHYPGFMSQIVDAHAIDGPVIIEPHHIVTHLTTFRRPKGTYDIPRETLVVCWALNRGRR